ncbi:MAG: PH domain-containing protein [Saprospiraceae bacterium]|nr:PH domain-containing protein [Saprospiraceae bacterium]
METNNEQAPVNIHSNEQILLSDLPKLDHIVYEPIQKPLLYVNLLVTSMVFLMAMLGLVILNFMVEELRRFMWLMLAGNIFLFGLIAWFEIKSFNYRGFAIRNHDILYKYGWLWRSLIVVPFNRIQHLEINQGPIDRMFDLASLQLFTAGGSSSDLEITGLSPTQAADIKAFIMQKNSSIETDESE